MKAIINAKLILGEKIIGGKILCFDETILAICDTVPAQVEVLIDAQGAFVSPGFIDLHIHGAGGADVMDATFASLEIISQTLLQTGTTAFLATTMTMSSDAITQALQSLQCHAKEVSGAKIVGVHLEGPFLNPLKHGAQDPTHIQQPNQALIAPFMDQIQMITLAPEMPGAQAFIEQMKADYPHVILSIGHSNASYEEAEQSFGWGVSHATHLFNAMPPYHHREPGVVGAVFQSSVSCDMIPDGIHTHPMTLELVYQIKQEKLIFITDAMRAGCMKNGTYDLGGQKVLVEGRKALLEDGTLAGSVLKMNEGIAYLLKETSLTLPEIIRAITVLPAQKLGLKKGMLKEGYDADIVIFDEKCSIISTIIAGEVKYSRK